MAGPEHRTRQQRLEQRRIIPSIDLVEDVCPLPQFRNGAGEQLSWLPLPDLCGPRFGSAVRYRFGGNKVRVDQDRERKRAPVQRCTKRPQPVPVAMP